jgi:malate dehydrogenase (oxaloacetate-decarboxylating)
LASVVADELRPDLIVPSPVDERVAPAVAAAAVAGRSHSGTAGGCL